MWWGPWLPHRFWVEQAQSPPALKLFFLSGVSLQSVSGESCYQGHSGTRRPWRVSLLGVGGDGLTAHIWGHLRQWGELGLVPGPVQAGPLHPPEGRGLLETAS